MRIYQVAGSAFLLLSYLGSVFGQPINDPLLIVKDGKYGYIDHSGKVAIQPRFYWASFFADGFAPVFVCGRIASIDSDGNILPYQHGDGTPYVAQKGKKVGFANAEGKWAIPARFDEALPFSDGFAAVKIGDKWGFIDRTGLVKIPPIFDQAYYFHQGVGFVDAADKSFMIDKSGKTLAVGSMLSAVSESLVPLSRDDFSGFVDLQGRTVVPFIYDQVGPFSEGLAAVMKDGKYGYIDHGGKTVIPFIYEHAGDFHGGLSPARVGLNNGYIDRSGQFVLNLNMESLGDFAYGDVAIFWTKDGNGYVNRFGSVIWGPTQQWPDHKPLFGWTDDDKKRSCEGIPPAIQKKISAFSRW